MKVQCPACEKNHGELAPGEYRCVCTAEFRVESNPAKKKDSEFFEVKYAKLKSGPISVAKYKSLDDAKKFLADIKKDGWNGIIAKDGKPVKDNPKKKNPARNYRVWPGGVDFWEVRAGTEATGRLLGEVRFKNGRYQAWRNEAGRRGEWRIPGWISDGDAFRWVAGEDVHSIKRGGRKNPEELASWHFYPSWDMERTWEVFSGPGVRGHAGKRLGEIIRDVEAGGFKAFKWTEVPDTRKGYRGSYRGDIGESRSGFATKNDAGEWVAGELANPMGRPELCPFPGCEKGYLNTRIHNLMEHGGKKPIGEGDAPLTRAQFDALSKPTIAERQKAEEDLRNPMGRTKPKPKYSPYDRAQRRARKTARAAASRRGEWGRRATKRRRAVGRRPEA